MNISNIPVPAAYKEESADFRFFLKWFELALSKVQYDTEEFFDLFDPLRCPEDLLWMLGETMGYKYDSRMTPAFNRLALVYFMSMIRLKGSKDGVTLAAQVNLDQFKLQKLAEENSILNNRLEDTSIPSNSIYIQPHVEKGYIDLVYFSDKVPEDVCTEYTRPVGMYMVPHAGVRYDAKMRISVDSRLTNTNDLNISIGSTHVGHYSADDYSRFQRLSRSDYEGLNVKDTDGLTREERFRDVTPQTLTDTRNPVWYRNSAAEVQPDENINPGYRALYSLQLVNGSDSTVSLLTRSPDISIRSLSPDDVSVFDEESGETYDNEYYVRGGYNALDSVESTPMGSFGVSMETTDVEGQ